MTNDRPYNRNNEGHVQAHADAGSNIVMRHAGKDGISSVTAPPQPGGKPTSSLKEFLPKENHVRVQEVLFTEDGAGTYTGTVELPAGHILHNIIVNGRALWTAETSAAMIVGDTDDPNGFFDAVNLKATDLLAGESLDFANAGGKAGAYIANSHVTDRYSADARNIIGSVTSVGAGTAGRTSMTVVYSIVPADDVIAATKA